jgi:hypothetical protein
MPQITVKIATEFTRTPGSRYRSEGEFSGQSFRNSVLLPKVRQAVDKREPLLVDLDGTAGYATSFLEEAFGGLVREEGVDGATLLALLKIKSNEEPYLEDDIRRYILDAQRAAKAS